MFVMLLAGVLLLLAEVFLPGGIVGTLGLLCLVTGVVLAFTEGPQVGMTAMLAVLVFGGVGLWAWVKYFPSSAVGKQMFLSKSAKDWHGFSEKNREWLGKNGVAHTMLRPGGTATIGGERVDVVTEGQMIEKGTPVKVVHVEGNRVVVEVDESPNADESTQSGAASQADTGAEESGNEDRQA